MREVRRGLKVPGAGALVLLCLLLPALMAWSTEKPRTEPGAKVFPLEEIPLQDSPEPARGRLRGGTVATQCGDSPIAGITYPAFRSHKPIYGIVTFDESLFDPQAGLRYAFAVDESAGMGYDRFYFDFNHDSDLSREAAVHAMKEVPTGMPSNAQTVWFEKIEVRLDYGREGVWTQAIMPRLMKAGKGGLMFFVAPTARKGKIVLGSEEMEVVLGQSFSLAGRYDRPMTGVFLAGQTERVPIVGYWRKVNRAFYRLSPSPAGDRIVVEPYAGPLGTFELDAGGRDIPLSLEGGYLLSRNSIVDLTTCRGEDGQWTVPVGDYRPVNLFLRCGPRRIVVRPNSSQAGQKTAPPAVFPLRVRAGQPCTFDLSEKPRFVFRTPGAGQRIKRGDTMKAEAVLLLPRTGAMIVALDDMTKKTQTIKRPDGADVDLYESVDPVVTIVNSSGQTVAEGRMPFG